MKKMLLIRQGGIGDCVMTLPVIERLSKEWDLEIWVPFPVVPLLREYKVRSLEACGIYTLKHSIASGQLQSSLKKFDRIVSWHCIPEFRDMMQICRIEVEFLEPVQRFERIHMVDYFLRQHDYFDVGAVPRLNVVRRTLGNHVVFNPFSGSSTKNWPLSKFIQLARGLDVRWICGPTQDCGPGIHSVRYDNLYALANWLTSARMYVGNDSGITHLAAAIGVPTIALFGPTNPMIWGPRGYGTVSHLRGYAFQMKNLEVIRVIEEMEDFYAIDSRATSSNEGSGIPAGKRD
jgi:heptosyltransferase III